MSRTPYLRHKNWYLWWGLGSQSLSERAVYSKQTVADMQREYDYVMSTNPRLEKAPRRPTAKPTLLTLGST